MRDAAGIRATANGRIFAAFARIRTAIRARHGAAAAEPTANVLIKRPVAAYVDKVHEEGDFSQLGIGT